MDGIRTERDGGIFELTLDRPKANAIDSATSRAMGEAFIEFREDPGLRVAIVTGAGDRFFSAGWDLKAHVAGDPDDFGEGGLGGLTELFDLDKPVIAAVNGYAAGGGFELVLACDMALAVPGARFSLPEVKLGFIADSGGIFRLPRRIPHPLAMEMLLTGDPIGAAEAERWGLVNRVVGAADLLPAARELAARVEATAPLATRAVKATLASTERLTVEEGFRALRDGSIPAYDRAVGSADAREGPRAFAEGREPVWRGE